MGSVKAPRPSANAAHRTPAPAPSLHRDTRQRGTGPAPRSTKNQGDKAKPRMQAGCRQTPAPVNESGGWARRALPQEGLLIPAMPQAALPVSLLPTPGRGQRGREVLGDAREGTFPPALAPGPHRDSPFERNPKTKTISNPPVAEKPLKREPNEQTGRWLPRSRPEQGPFADNTGPCASFAGRAPLRP